MLNKQEEACLMIVASVCAQDGLISQAEVDVIFGELKKKYPKLGYVEFDEYIDRFFDSDDVIEDYLLQVTDKRLRSFTLELAEKSASADGLDTRENVALQKAINFWEI